MQSDMGKQFMNDTSLTDITEKYAVIDRFLAYMEVSRLEDFSSHLSSNLDKIIEGFTILNDKLASTTRRSSIHAQNILDLRGELRHHQSSMDRQDRVLDEVKKAKDAVQNRHDSLVMALRNKQQKSAQQRQELTKELQQLKKQHAFITNEYKKKEAKFRAAQQTIDKYNNKNVHYKNEFIFARGLMKPPLMDQKYESLDELWRDKQQELMNEVRMSLSIYQQAFEQLIDKFNRVKKMGVNAHQTLELKNLPSQALKPALNCFIQNFDKLIDDYIECSSNRKSGFQSAGVEFSDISGCLSKNYKLLAESQNRLLTGIINKNVEYFGQKPPPIDLSAILGNSTTEDPLTNEAIESFAENAENYLKETQLTVGRLRQSMLTEVQKHAERCKEFKKEIGKYNSVEKRVRQVEQSFLTAKRKGEGSSADRMESE